MAVRSDTGGETRFDTASATRLDTAGNRSELPATAIRRELYSHRCPSCFTISVRDGRRGFRNPVHACRAGCFSKVRQSMVARGMLYTGGVYSFVWRHAPPRRGQVT